MSDEVKIEESEMDEVSGGQRRPYPPKPFDIRDTPGYGTLNEQPNHPVGVSQDEWVNYRPYTIVFGDTLGGIASRFGMSIQQLMLVNNIKDPNWIVTGQELWVLK